MRFDNTIERAVSDTVFFDDPLDAITATVEAMRDLAIKSSINPIVRAFAIRATWKAPPTNFRVAIRHLTAVIRKTIRFVRDPVTSDLIQPPEYTIHAGGGDCDCLTTLFSACCLALGWRSAFILGSARRPDIPTHVLPAARAVDYPRWTPVEISARNVPVGVIPKRFKIMQYVQVA